MEILVLKIIVQDLPYNEFKKRIAFRKEYWPDVDYELIYFSN